MDNRHAKAAKVRWGDIAPENKRTVLKSLKLSPRETASLKAKAKAAGLSETEYLVKSAGL